MENYRLEFNKFQMGSSLQIIYNMITISEAAKEKIKDLLIEENNEQLYLRTFVQGGGCAGFSYGFCFDEEKADDDFEFVENSVKVIIDSMSMQYLEGSTIDYKETLMGSNFTIINPNANSTCGCGSSFSMSSDFFTG